MVGWAWSMPGWASIGSASPSICATICVLETRGFGGDQGRSERSGGDKGDLLVRLPLYHLLELGARAVRVHQRQLDVALAFALSALASPFVAVRDERLDELPVALCEHGLAKKVGAARPRGVATLGALGGGGADGKELGAHAVHVADEVVTGYLSLE